MSDNNQNERKLQRENLEYLRDFFENDIDDTIKEYIFDSDDFEESIESTDRYVFYMRNILSLAFIFAHGCYKYDCNHSPSPCKTRTTKHNSQRIINSLEKAFVNYPVTSELVQFVLTDIQFDMVQGSNNSELFSVFENLCNFNSTEFSLIKYFKVISQWKSSPSRYSPSIYGMKDSDISGMLCELLDNMLFLQTYRLHTDDNSLFSFVPKGRSRKLHSIPIPYLLYKNEEKYFGIFTLFNVEKTVKDQNKVLELRYISCDESSTISVIVSDDSDMDLDDKICQDPEEVYSDITGGDSWNPANKEETSEKSDNFIDQIHTINYKYIKNLALAISDAISMNVDAKNVLHRYFYNDHKDIFGNIGKGNDWDGLIVMLLIEASPTSVLEALVRGGRQNFYNICSNICKRIDNPNMPIYGKTNDELDKLVENILKNKSIIGEAYAFGKLYAEEATERLFPRAAAILIVSSLTVLENDTEKKIICAGNISDNKMLLASKKNELFEVKIKYVSVILAETFRHLLCFYKGLLEYGKIKIKFDAESSNKCLSEKQIETYQDKLTTGFLEAASAEAAAIKKYESSNPESSIILMNRFLDLCKSSKSSSALFSTLGKHEIMDVNDFENCIFHYLGELSPINENNIENWLEFALNILEYLKTGSFNDTPIDCALFNAVYPFSVVYNRGNENYDGYRTATFSLNIDIDGDGRSDFRCDINVLTEFSYRLSNAFYCLPNTLRSNKKWWIDPLLVDFKDFNDIFTA